MPCILVADGAAPCRKADAKRLEERPEGKHVVVDADAALPDVLPRQQILQQLQQRKFITLSGSELNLYNIWGKPGAPPPHGLRQACTAPATSGPRAG